MDGIQQQHLPGVNFVPAAIAGLIWAYRFREGYEPEPVDPRDVPAALAAEDGWLWLHFSLTDRLARDWLSSFEDLPEEVRALFLAKDEPLGLHTIDHVIFGVIADFHSELGGESDHLGRLRFALNERLVISGRRHPLRSVEEIHRAVQKGLNLPAAGRLIETIIDRFCDSVARRVAGMTDELDTAEDRVVEDMAATERVRLIEVRRMTVRVHRQLSSLCHVLRDWEERSEEADKPALPIAAERLADRLESLDHDILTLQERAKLLQDEVGARLAEETNRSLRALSILTALLLPGSLVAGIFGMNTKDLPFLETEGGFWFAILIGAAATALFYWILRRVGAGLRI
ncbi:transporter [Labrys sp. LIt4]|uniref:transporter n=1 Tax=Labrys sp. LIt4 TaxID=2821355 RepID=UPI001ADF6F36|nr:transporter [Labrys sp. LIt4]MBP0582107.1 transporter [Labrys sp. LIt4]